MKRNKSSQEHDAPSSDFIECNVNTNQTETDNGKHVRFKNKCRICLDRGTFPIFGDDEMPDISEDMKTFGNIEISKDDQYPKYICDACEKLLQAAVFFRKTAEESDRYLKSNLYREDCNKIEDPVKIEVDADLGTNGGIETVNSELNIKEDIIIEPSYFLGENLFIEDAFNNSENLEEHNANPNLQIVENSTVSLHVKQKNYSCKTCDIDFPTAKVYALHRKSAKHKKMRQSKKIECEICFKSISRAFYNRHMETHSSDKNDDKLQCPICNKSYVKTYFNYHLTHAHNEDDKKSQLERIQCTVCHKHYEKHYYKFHLAIHNDSSKYICDACGKSFIQQSAFKRHKLVHGNELAYKCTQCPYLGRHPGLLKTHMQTHTRDYQHRCMECPARFLTKSNLNKHLQRHKGPIDFKCDHCKRGFYSKLDLDRHFEVDHLGVKNHVCNVCGKTFGYRNAMMSHQLKVHKREKLTNGKGRLPLYLEINKKNDD